MKVEELAELVHMSVSSIHEHFKSVTSMSPLQYQKVLRLQEARRLRLSTMMDAGSASHRVGYLSASQFSREYSRFFGSVPTRDMARLRQETRPRVSPSGDGMTAPARLPARSSNCRRKVNERLRGLLDFPCTLPSFGNQTYNKVFLWIPSLESLRRIRC